MKLDGEFGVESFEIFKIIPNPLGAKVMSLKSCEKNN